MKKLIQLLLYSIAFVGIGIDLFFDVRVLGLVGYTSLLIASIIQIVKMINKQ